MLRPVAGMIAVISRILQAGHFCPAAAFSPRLPARRQAVSAIREGAACGRGASPGPSQLQNLISCLPF